MNKYDDAILLVCSIVSLICGAMVTSFEIIKYVGLIYNPLNMGSLTALFTMVYVSLMLLIEYHIKKS